MCSFLPPVENVEGEGDYNLKSRRRSKLTFPGLRTTVGKKTESHGVLLEVYLHSQRQFSFKRYFL